jgi:hypothetical protein
MPRSKPSRLRAVKCVICGTEFQTRHSQGKYCSPDHQREGERASWRKYGNNNSEKRNQYHKELYISNPEIVSARVKEYHSTPEGKLAVKKSRSKQIEKFPEKIAARSAVARAVQSGKLTRKPCERCGRSKRIQAHHEDYSKPLEVIWLCISCHTKEHGRAVSRLCETEVKS